MDLEAMLGQPAGWFRDPAPRDPSAPDTWRFWSGTGWTATTRTASKRERREWREEAAAAQVAQARDLVARAEAGDQEAQWQLAAAAGPRPVHPARPGTADGQCFGGWWARVAASLVDGVVVTLLGSLFAWPFLQRILVTVDRFAAAAGEAARHGEELPSVSALTAAVAGAVLAATLVFALTSLVFEVGFLMSYQATPGKLLLGLRVRPGEGRGPLSWRAALLRWTGKNGVGVVQLVPFGVLPYTVYVLLDYLWPLGDRNRQALHDKLARTYVVRRA